MQGTPWKAIFAMLTTVAIGLFLIGSLFLAMTQVEDQWGFGTGVQVYGVALLIAFGAYSYLLFWFGKDEGASGR
jgi:hypothetical protein